MQKFSNISICDWIWGYRAHEYGGLNFSGLLIINEYQSTIYSVSILLGPFRDNDRWMDKSKNLKLPQPRHLWRSRGGFYLRAPFPSWMVGSILVLFSKIRDVRRITVMMLMLLSSKCLWDNQVKCSREMESVLGIENHYNTETARDWKGQVKGKQRRT